MNILSDESLVYSSESKATFVLDDWEEVAEAMYRVRRLQYYKSLPNFHPALVEKRSGLKGLGVSDEEIERLCQPKEFDRAAMMEEMIEIEKREQKSLAKMNRESRNLRLAEKARKH